VCLALRLRIRDGAIAAWAREAQGVDVLRAIASATRVAAGKHVGVATLQGEGDRKHKASLGVGAAPHVGGGAAAKGARTVTTGLLPHVLRWRGVGVTELETTVYM
jgi:hypothetical protein